MAKTYINGYPVTGSTSYASAITYVDEQGNKTTVQDKISEMTNGFGEDVNGVNIHEKLDQIINLYSAELKPATANIVFTNFSSSVPCTYTPDWENYNVLYITVTHPNAYNISRVYQDGTNELVDSYWGSNILDVTVNADGSFKFSTTAGSVKGICIVPTNKQ